MLEFVNCTRQTKNGLVSYDAGYLANNIDMLLANSQNTTLNFKEGGVLFGIDLHKLLTKISVDQFKDRIGTIVETDVLIDTITPPSINEVVTWTPYGVVKSGTDTAILFQSIDGVGKNYLIVSDHPEYTIYREKFGNETFVVAPIAQEDLPSIGLPQNRVYHAVWKVVISDVGILFSDKSIDTGITLLQENNPQIYMDYRFPHDNEPHNQFSRELIGGAWKVGNATYSDMTIKDYASYQYPRFYMGTSYREITGMNGDVRNNVRITHDGQLYLNGVRHDYASSIGETMTDNTRNIILGIHYDEYCDVILWEYAITNGDQYVRQYLAVEAGSTMYSDTPAPNNCMWEVVSKTYVGPNCAIVGAA